MLCTVVANNGSILPCKTTLQTRRSTEPPPIKNANQAIELTSAMPSCFHATGIKHQPASVPVTPGGRCSPLRSAIMKIRHLALSSLLAISNLAGASTKEIALADIDQSCIGKYLVVQTDLPYRLENYRRFLPDWAVWKSTQGLILSGRLDSIQREYLYFTLPTDKADSRRESPVTKSHILRIWIK